jgi:hypothetical protein
VRAVRRRAQGETPAPRGSDAPRLDIVIERLDVIAEPPQAKATRIERTAGLTLHDYLRRGVRR